MEDRGGTDDEHGRRCHVGENDVLSAISGRFLRSTVSYRMLTVARAFIRPGSLVSSYYAPPKNNPKGTCALWTPSVTHGANFTID